MKNKLNEWKQITEAATPGPWEATIQKSGAWENIYGIRSPRIDWDSIGLLEQDADFIAAAREAMPTLIKQAECDSAVLSGLAGRIEALQHELQEALEREAEALKMLCELKSVSPDAIRATIESRIKESKSC